MIWYSTPRMAAHVCAIYAKQIRQDTQLQQHEAIEALIKRVESFDRKVLKIELREWAQPIAHPLADNLSGEWQNTLVARAEFESAFLP